MIISFDRKFAFVHLAKTAGDSVTEALAPHAGKDSFRISNDFQAWRDSIIRYRYHRFYKLHKHSTASEIKSAVGSEVWDGLYTFAFVREPLARVLSLYTFIERKAEERARILPRNLWYLTLMGRKDDPKQWPAMVAYTETKNFSDFIRHPSLLDDQAMLEQAGFLHDAAGTLLVDFVGRVENIDADIEEIAGRLGIEDICLPMVNQSARTISRQEISVEDRNYIFDLYREDYKKFYY